MPGLVWFWASVGLYGLSAALYLAFLLGVGQKAAGAARWVLLLAFVAHTVEVGARGVAGYHPVTSVRETIGFVAWLIAGSFLAAQAKFALHAVGAFVVPASLVLLVAARLSPAAEAVPAESGLGLLGRVHIILVIVGLTAFALAAGLAAIYLIEDRALKRKKFGLLFKRGVALETLDRGVHRLVQVGFPVFTVAIVTGVAWSVSIGAPLRPEYSIAILAWAAFAALLIARMTAGWRGRRAATMTLVGFGGSLAVLGVYLMRHIAGA